MVNVANSASSKAFFSYLKRMYFCISRQIQNYRLLALLCLVCVFLVCDEITRPFQATLALFSVFAKLELQMRLMNARGHRRPFPTHNNGIFLRGAKTTWESPELPCLAVPFTTLLSVCRTEM